MCSLHDVAIACGLDFNRQVNFILVVHVHGNLSSDHKGEAKANSSDGGIMRKTLTIS